MRKSFRPNCDKFSPISNSTTVPVRFQSIQLAFFAVRCKALRAKFEVQVRCQQLIMNCN